jgi:catechol 2,3-dioxygenase-like lactoylglutathione lyase family enzyme
LISHISLGTNNLEESVQFYSEILALLGAKKIHHSDAVAFFEFPQSSAKLSITMPYDGNKATSGNGTMLALQAPGNDIVDSVYSKAIALGAVCEGMPGPRNDNAYYGAYFRDHCGNKIAVFFRPA